MLQGDITNIKSSLASGGCAPSILDLPPVKNPCKKSWVRPWCPLYTMYMHTSYFTWDTTDNSIDSYVPIVPCRIHRMDNFKGSYVTKRPFYPLVPLGQSDSNMFTLHRSIGLSILSYMGLLDRIDTKD